MPVVSILAIADQSAELLISVLGTMGAGFAWFANQIRVNAREQREHEKTMAERYERMGDKFGLAMTEACGSLERAVEALKDEITELRHGQADVCRVEQCHQRTPARNGKPRE